MPCIKPLSCLDRSLSHKKVPYRIFQQHVLGTALASAQPNQGLHLLQEQSMDSAHYIMRKGINDITVQMRRITQVHIFNLQTFSKKTGASSCGLRPSAMEQKDTDLNTLWAN